MTDSAVEQSHAATCLAHWSSGPVACCDRHAAGIQALGRMLGLHVPLTKLEQPAECANCINEARHD